MKTTKMSNNKNAHIITVLFYNDNAISVQEWANKVFLSRSALRRKLQDFGSPKYFIMEHRLTMARKALYNNPCASCEYIAHCAGFSDRTGLQQLLQRYFGISYKEFRENPDAYRIITNIPIDK